MKILHLADIHANGPNIEEIKKCCEFILETAIKEKPDLIVNASDTFESSDIRLDSAPAKYMFYFFSQLAYHAPVVSIIGTPYHDGKAAEAFNYIHSRFPCLVISDGPSQFYLTEDNLFVDIGSETHLGKKAIISAFPAPTKQWFNTDSPVRRGEIEIAEALEKIFAAHGAIASYFNCPNLLVGHWNVTGALISETQTLTGVDIDVSKDIMAAGDYDLIMLGHIHKAQQIGENIFFSGGIANHNWGEIGEKGFYIHDLGEPITYTPITRDMVEYLQSKGEEKETRAKIVVPIKSEFIKTPTRKLYDLTTCDMTDPAGGELDAILYTYNKEEYDGSKVRLRIKAFVDEADSIDKSGIYAFFESVNAEVDLETIRIPRENVRSERIQELDGLYEKIVENASIIGEPVPDGIEEKCEMLETTSAEKIVEETEAIIKTL